MVKMFLDIETLPAPESEWSKLEYLFSRKLEKSAKKKEMSEEVMMAEEKRAKFEEYILGTSFDGSFGRILCIAYALDNEEVQVICHPEDETKILREFWTIADGVDLLVGHNVMEFDLRFIYQRSVKLTVHPSWRMNGGYNDPRVLSFARYKSAPIYDTMKEWTKWNRDSIGLEHIALALDIPTPKEGIDGSEVYTFFKAGKVKEICEYCKRDVVTTRAVYQKMTFEG